MSVLRLSASVASSTDASSARFHAVGVADCRRHGNSRSRCSGSYRVRISGRGRCGCPVEVLVRTFVPIGSDGLSLPQPSMAYPAASGLWVLCPIADYPFDVVATATPGGSVPVVLGRESGDGSLWRGSFTPTSTGEWTIVLRNFPTTEPTRIAVVESAPEPTALWIALIAVVVGLIGFALATARGICDPRSMTDAGRRG